jgi:hypothetical protein
MRKIRQAVNLIGNMGTKYVLFRVWFTLRKKTGLLKKAFPVEPDYKEFISLNDWKKLGVKFFFNSKDDVLVPRNPSAVLQEGAENILKGNLTFFSAATFCLGNNYDWVTNPDNGYKYDANLHWTAINDYSKSAGDVKFVWEKSRFSYLYTLIRYDYHFNIDQSSLVFNDIIDWIDKNPINRGPNYKCSQEISLRVLNWTFALNYYKHSSALTDVVFNKIMHSIYWQVKHVYSNINFSRIAVRNNHAITETMTLYLAGLLFPFFPGAKKWFKNGKRWFEKEVAYQVYPDGTFLQFSMNYHRVVVQLLTWALTLSELNNKTLDEIVKRRAKASLHFLLSCIDLKSGHLPNYGANDGALFFSLNDCDYRDYRPQLQALASVLDQPVFDTDYEDQHWFGLNIKQQVQQETLNGIKEFPSGGFYLLKEIDALTFLRCGKHKDRPSQADNLHLDVWFKNINVLRDGGSYKYNASDADMRYFFGTASHNTVMLGEHDQMQKGGRFIWYYWTQAIQAGWVEKDDHFFFSGSIKAFRHVQKNIVHSRSVKKYKNAARWEIIDEVMHSTDLPIHQLWHPLQDKGLHVTFTAFESDGKLITAKEQQGWHSPKYGIKEESKQVVFSTAGKTIRTIIEVTEGI